MTITCCIRYVLDPYKREAFEDYARQWLSIIPACGGDLVGYLMPHEGTDNVAMAMICFDCLASYEKYRGAAEDRPARHGEFPLRADRAFILARSGPSCAGGSVIAVIFEVEPREGQRDTYLGIAAALRPLLDGIDGFISIERFESLVTPGKILSLSFHRDEVGEEAFAREHPDVAAATDDDARLAGVAKGGCGLCHARRRGAVRCVVAAIKADRFRRHQRRQIGDALQLHQREGLGRAAVAVLDGVDAGDDRAADALVAGVHGWRRGGPSACATSTAAPISSIEKVGTVSPSGSGAVVGIELDPVGAMARLVAHGAHDLVDRRSPPRRPAGNSNRAGSSCAPGRTIRWPRWRGSATNSRGPGDDALVDGALQRDIGIARAFGAEIAQRGEAGAPASRRHGDRRARVR